MKATGKFRVFHYPDDPAPLVWGVAYLGGDDAKGARPLWELYVRGIGFDHVIVETNYHPDEKDGLPFAFLEASGELEVLPDGFAVIRRVA